MRIVYFCLILLVAAFSVASCSSTRHVQEEGVGMVTYAQYFWKGTPGKDTLFMTFSDQGTFDAAFGSTGGERKPDFYGQTVVAIYTPGQGPRMVRAARAGNTMNVYAVTCAAGSTGCPSNGISLATVPRAGSITQVRFFIDSVARRTVSLQ